MGFDEVLAQADQWYLSNRPSAKNTSTVGIWVSHLVASKFPLTRDDVSSPDGGQVKGLSSASLRRILTELGETRSVPAEGGRTSRGTLPKALTLMNVLNDSRYLASLDEDARADASRELQLHFLRRFQVEHLDRAGLKPAIDTRVPVQHTVAAILKAAREVSGGNSGAVAQHLVGAKLERRFPGVTIGRDRYSAGDQQTGRQGDFQVGDTAIHVTTSPSQGLISRCAENRRHQIRSLALVPAGRVAAAVQLLDPDSEGLAGVMSIEDFVGSNVEEMGGFRNGQIRVGLRALLETYNERITSIEHDTSLLIEIPANL